MIEVVSPVKSCYIVWKLEGTPWDLEHCLCTAETHKAQSVTVRK